MGEPKFSRAKYTGPSHPWDGDRIKEEKGLVKKYGLKNKQELWRAQSALRNFRRTARNLQARLRSKDVQAEKESEELIAKLQRIGLLGEDADLNEVLALQVEVLLNRRLQTVVHLKGLAYSVKQSRQFINHGHIALRGRKVTIPGYIIKVEDDEVIAYNDMSPLNHELHPMRPKTPEERELEAAEAAAKAAEAEEEAKAAAEAKQAAKAKADKKEEAKADKKTEGEAKADKKTEGEAKADKKTEGEAKADKKTEGEAEGGKKTESEAKEAPKDLDVKPGGDS